MNFSLDLSVAFCLSPVEQQRTTTMFWIFLGLLVAIEATKLENTYLPPPAGAKEAGGSDGALQVPLEPPYVEPYSPIPQPSKSVKLVETPASDVVNENEENSYDNEEAQGDDEVKIPVLQRGRFISGSYSYKGRDNVLVTVTYKADMRKSYKDSEEETDNKDEVEEGVKDTVLNDEEEVEKEDGLVAPTPLTLPAELARAFDFHKKMQLAYAAQEGKTNTRLKKPLKKLHNKKSHERWQYIQKTQPHSNGHYVLDDQQGNQNRLHNQLEQGLKGYHYGPQNQYGPSTIYQGYSYPKRAE